MQIWVTIRSCKKIRRKSKVLQIYDDQTVYYTAPKLYVKITDNGSYFRFKNLYMVLIW